MGRRVQFTKNGDTVQTLAPDRADEPFREGVLPTVRRGQHFADPQALHSLLERVAVDRVVIAEEVGWRGVVRECLHDLLGGPAVCCPVPAVEP
jgi:hypothetical protein